MAGRIAIITGGGGGIGAATAELFCRHGAKVLIVDRNGAGLAREVARIRQLVSASAIESFPCDITKFDEAQGAVAHAVGAFGGLNVLVNNAAVRYLASIAGADTGEWEKLLEVNVLGAVNFCKAAVRELRKSGTASVVNVSSCYAVRGRKGFGAYDVSKAGLLALTRTFAAEEAEHGIRVNAVCPGGTLTPFTIGRNAPNGLSEDALRAQVKPDSLLRRWAESAEIAHPILFLASSEASFITGATLMVDGGLSTL
jgi:meso-butanediol dehydrogenase/(S,S)-butanediol dehydrogenase/diacetyl reductase